MLVKRPFNSCLKPMAARYVWPLGRVDWDERQPHGRQGGLREGRDSLRKECWADRSRV
jgi:hypothetical protein